ncbi:hypothetical protein [Amycolatopsis thailandensis]|uniref:hypothetical protein n=1 Tax=Amycolatopsis thailandensis TaxID=589330 RepID=UPI0036281A58
MKRAAAVLAALLGLVAVIVVLALLALWASSALTVSSRATPLPTTASSTTAPSAAPRHEVVISITGADGNGLSTFSILPSLINPYAFSTTGSDGVTNQAETDTCVSPKALPSAYAPNRTYTGQIAIATTATIGTLQLTDGTGALGPGAHGWEWSY